MKSSWNVAMAITIVFTLSTTSQAQLLEKLRRKAEQKVENAVDKGIDNIGKKNKKNEEKGSQNRPEKPQGQKSETPASTRSDTPTLGKGGQLELWTKYDFIPGKEVVFYDDFKTESYGDFPSKWELYYGNVEVAKLGMDKVVLMKGEHPTLLPKFSISDYMVGPTTIEMDIYCGEGFWKSGGSSYIIRLYKPDGKYDSDYGDGSGHYLHEIDIEYWGKNLVVSMGSNFETKVLLHQLTHKEGWHHISLFTNNGQLKLYFDQHKMLNIPDTKVKPTAFSITSDLDYADDIMAMKQIKIAKGGEKPFQKIATEGKYVSNGIMFDKGKATLQSRSAGVILKMAQAMEDNPEWKIHIIGHTDSDGESATNLKLSEQRAKSVQKALIDHGIKATRMTTEGKGESEPLKGGNTAEAKASNRRVEFVLIK